MFTKVLFVQLLLLAQINLSYAGNNKDIILEVKNPNLLGIRKKSDNPVKITFKPR